MDRCRRDYGFRRFALLSKYLMSCFSAVCGAGVAAADAWSLSRICVPSAAMVGDGLGSAAGWKAKLMVFPRAGLTLVAFAIVVALTTIAGPALGLAFLTEVPAGVMIAGAKLAGSLPHCLLWLASSGRRPPLARDALSRLPRHPPAAAIPDGWLGSVFAVAIQR